MILSICREQNLAVLKGSQFLTQIQGVSIHDIMRAPVCLNPNPIDNREMTDFFSSFLDLWNGLGKIQQGAQALGKTVSINRNSAPAAKIADFGENSNDTAVAFRKIASIKDYPLKPRLTCKLSLHSKYGRKPPLKSPRS